MKHTVTLPRTSFTIEYDETVYNPGYTSMGSIFLANKLIKDAEKPGMKILDVGCGTGVLGLGIKRSNPDISLTSCDIDKNAIKTTEKNAKPGESTIIRCSLLPRLGEWDIVVANLPTFDPVQMQTESLHGPRIAYSGGKDPLRLYRDLFKKSQNRTRALVCECQRKHQKAFLKLAKEYNWEQIMRSGDCFAFWQL